MECRGIRQSQRGVRYLLQGLLVYKACGYAYDGGPVNLTGVKGKRRAYAFYRCIAGNAYRFGGQHNCRNK